MINGPWDMTDSEDGAHLLVTNEPGCQKSNPWPGLLPAFPRQWHFVRRDVDPLRGVLFVDDASNTLNSQLDFRKRQTPDQGRFFACPFLSGRRASKRRRKGGRLNFAAVCSMAFTSTGSQPYGLKKAEPSAGANLNGAPTLLKCLPVVFCIIFRSPGEPKSMIQRWKLAAFARSRASAATSSSLK